MSILSNYRFERELKCFKRVKTWSRHGIALAHFEDEVTSDEDIELYYGNTCRFLKLDANNGILYREVEMSDFEHRGCDGGFRVYYFNLFSNKEITDEDVRVARAHINELIK